ncbi:MAG: hypothetical protein MJ233_00585 [Mycoplasmoidaceae bacterium]|nr:hypothetical protein [Mycoplasmoidaceae bacterium]
MSKEKRNVKPILLATSIIGFVLFAFVIALGVCMTMLYVDTDLLPIKTSRLCEIHIGVGILTAAALVCAILFMV